MVATYGEITTTVKNFLVSVITELDATTASVGNIDYVVDGLLADQDISTGLVLDFLYSEPHATDSGRRTIGDLWDTYLGGLLIVRFSGREDTEADKVIVLNLLWRAFDSGSAKVMDGIDKVRIIRIDAPEKSAIGEQPYYFLPFTLKVNHGGKP